MVHRDRLCMEAIYQRIATLNDKTSLKEFMQGGTETSSSRYVLWNFDNIVAGRSGTIEFRGGPSLNDRAGTNRWIAFAVAFVHLCTTLVSDNA